MTTSGTRSLRLGSKRVPVILPRRTDARLHTAAVIISIHVIGMTALAFRVSVPQILTAIVTAALIDIAVTLWRTGMLVWPASGMLTGSGVALILRVTGMESGDYWSWEGWPYFAGVAAFSILTKHLLVRRGDHIFNPSNLGLVVAFLILGSSVVEPLDFWWAPLEPWMIVAYGLILGGGILITRRLRLLEMALTFWVTLAIGLGVLSASGHCMTASWSSTAVCGARFWSVVVTSPETLIFLLFMITDPKTIPTERWARVAFAATLGVLATLLIAPQTVEFGAKVSLLGSLVAWTPLRGLFDRLLTEREPAGEGMPLRRAFSRARQPSVAFASGAAIGSLVVLAAVGIVAAGAPARQPALAASPTSPLVTTVIDPATLPEVAVDPSVGEVNLGEEGDVGSHLARTLAENLAIEAETLRRADASLLPSATAGGRLVEMQARIDDAITTGERVVPTYTFDTMSLRVADSPDVQAAVALEMIGDGEVELVTFDVAGEESGRTTRAFHGVFTMRRVAGDRWLTVAATIEEG